jgi:predicted permease
MLNHTILLNNKAYQVVGVMPRGFSFPKQSDLWIPMSVPLTFETFEPFRGWLGSEVIARLAPGVSFHTASSQLLARWRLGIARDSSGASETNLPEVVNDLQRTGTLIPLKDSLIGDRRSALVVLLGATTLLLLIACANVTNLLLSQAVTRRRELAVREVLGATRIRVVRQLLTESALLALAGALMGLAVAPVSLGLLRNLMPAGLAGVAPMRVDLRLLAFATLLGLVTGVTFGLWPALRTTGSSLGDMIKSGGGHGSSVAGAVGARRALVAVEIALTIVLLIGAGLMLRSFNRLMHLDQGLKSQRVGTLEMSFSSSANARVARQQLATRLLERMAATPGITTAGLINSLPLGGAGGILLSIKADGMPEVKNDERPGPLQLFASAGYFEAIGIPLIAGRSLTAADDSLAPPVAVINEQMARLYWPGENALGRTFHNGDEVVTIVGIVRDVRESRLDEQALPQMYLSIYRNMPSTVALVARGTLPPKTLLAAMQGAVRAVDPSQAVFHLRTMDEVMNSSVAPRRTNTVLISLFGALALILSSLGIYAVVAHGVAQRSREFGIRSALGATGPMLVRGIVLDMLRVGGLGIASGVAVAWCLARVASSLLYGVTVHDFPTFALVPIVLLIPAAIATIVPARRALRIDPAEVMRTD